MKYIADLHIHSRFSRATSKQLDFVALHRGALEKGITLVGTGDFTHPGWMAEIASQLEPAEPGFFKLRKELAVAAEAGLPPACSGMVRFVLQVEISNIYKKADRTRKNHNLVFVPSIDAAKRFAERLESIGNIASDGRPILGLDARDLLEITLETHEHAFLVPAHIWTPWFSMLGSKSGFDSVDECFGDLASEIFAVETGLSSDPPMNWRMAELDRMTLVSNSDAHSAAKLGREANLLDTELAYLPLLEALKTGRGFEGTLEFFPEEGKYHLDGHRKCDLRLSPEETAAYDGRCPKCGGKLTVGVMSRVMDLASPDRPEGYTPKSRAPFESLVPLPEVIGEVLGVGPSSKKVAALTGRVLAELGPELHVLKDAPLEDIERIGGAPLREAIDRIRRGDMSIDAGYDGEFGKVKVFTREERDKLLGQTGFFGLAGFHQTSAPTKLPRSPNKAPTTPKPPKPRKRPKRPADIDDTGDPLALLNPDQRRVAECLSGPIVVTAGPGTGKTRTLVSRIAHQLATGALSPEAVLAISFTNQAALELKERIERLLPDAKPSERPLVTTFHGFGRYILDTYAKRPVSLIEDEQREALVKAACGGEITGKILKSALGDISLAKQTRDPSRALADSPLAPIFDRYEAELNALNALDIDDLVLKAYQYLEANPEAAAQLRNRFSSISIDEYQDINDVQAGLIKTIAGAGENLLVIGDPDQAIYGFRGAEPGHFTRFDKTYPKASTVSLGTTYRLTEETLKCAVYTLGAPRPLTAVKRGPKVEIAACPTPESEAEQVLIRLEGLVGGSSHFALDSGRGGALDEPELGFGDIAILTRIKRQREAIITALERSGIPCQRIGEDEPHDPRSEKVAVMTMHAAKGREFEAVFITGVEPGLVPLDLPGLTSDTDEERRLLFVAITRAKRHAVLSYAKKRALFGRALPGGPSPFIVGMPMDAAVHTRPELKARPEKKQLKLF